VPGQLSPAPGGLAAVHGSENAAVDALAPALDAEEVARSHAEELLAAALAYAPRTIPLWAPRARVPCPGKSPSVGAGWPTWRATPETIRAWWADHPADNLGIRTGAGLIVLDVDPRAGGDDVLADLEHEHAELPVTVTCATGGGGRHLYFRGPRDLASFDLGAGVEVKAAGHQVVAPPSVHPQTGVFYQWAEGRAPGDLGLAQLPPWVSAGRQERRERPSRTPTSEWVALVRDGLTDGERNNGLARLVGHLLAKDVDARLAAELAHVVNERGRPPLPTREVDQVVASICGREVRRRQTAGAR
jgi:hypothetical protein